MVISRAQLRSRVFASAPHVVVLGAGATKACLDEFGGDAGGRASPLMDEIPDVVPGVADLLKEAKEAGAEISANFETTYAGIRSSGPLDDLADRLEAAVREYFSGLRIPDSATIYDHLCLALRPKDLIASFNWDPLLGHRWARGLRPRACRPVRAGRQPAGHPKHPAARTAG